MAVERRQPLIRTDPATVAVVKKPAGRFGEIVGAKTAECAAICCCCPCAVIDIVFLTLVKLPAGLFKKAMKKRRKRREKRRVKKALAAAEIYEKNKKEKEGGGGGGDAGVRVARREEEMVAKSPSLELKEKEEEMWAHFHNTGFWRSPSQRDKC